MLTTLNPMLVRLIAPTPAVATPSDMVGPYLIQRLEWLARRGQLSYSLQLDFRASRLPDGLQDLASGPHNVSAVHHRLLANAESHSRRWESESTVWVLQPRCGHPVLVREVEDGLRLGGLRTGDFERFGQRNGLAHFSLIQHAGVSLRIYSLRSRARIFCIILQVPAARCTS